MDSGTQGVLTPNPVDLIISPRVRTAMWGNFLPRMMRCGRNSYGFRNSCGSFAIFAPIRRGEGGTKNEL